MPEIVLHEPEIPYNTGNIGRTCLNAGSGLHLIEPLGFMLTDKYIRRAGLDYWDKLDVSLYVNYEDFMEKHGSSVVWYATTKARRLYTDADFSMEDFVMFGSESSGIPEEILCENEERCIRIPMMSCGRSLNLCNSVAVILYEMLRQNGFQNMEKYGQLHRLKWKD